MSTWELGIGGRSVCWRCFRRSSIFDAINSTSTHIFPRSRFTRKRLQDAGVAVEEVDVFMECADRIANLQLLDGTSNIEKQAKLPVEWIDAQFPTEEARRHYREKYLLDHVPGEMAEFLKFYKARRTRLQDRIRQLVNSV